MAERSVMIKLGAKMGAGGKRALAGIRKGIRSLGASAKKALNFGKYIAAGGAAAAVTLGVLIKKVADAGDKLDKMSKRTGLSVRFLNQLSHAADLGGTSLDIMERASKKLAQSAADAKDGLKTYTREFEKLGISVMDQTGALKEPEQLFMETVDALSKMKSQTQKAATAAKLFGRAGTQLLPMLEGGKRGLKSLMKEAEALGYVWDKKSAKAAADFKDELSRLRKMAGGVASQFAMDLIPRVTEVLETFRAWYTQNRELINQKIGEWARGVGEAMTGAYEKIKEWTEDGTFELWWERVKLAALGVNVVIQDVIAGGKQVVGFVTRARELSERIDYALEPSEETIAGLPRKSREKIRARQKRRLARMKQLGEKAAGYETDAQIRLKESRGEYMRQAEKIAKLQMNITVRDERAAANSAMQAAFGLAARQRAAEQVVPE